MSEGEGRGAGSAEGVSDRGDLPPGFVRRGVTVLGLALVGLLVVVLVWRAADVFLVLFAGVLLGVFLLALRDSLAAHTPLTPGWALAVVLVLMLGLLAGGTALLVPQLAEQADAFTEKLPELVAEVEAFLEGYGWGRQLLESLQDGPGGPIAETIAGLLGSFAVVLTHLVAFLFIGLFVAVNPRLYTEGIVGLMPREKRARTRVVLGEIGHTLRWFLVARAIAMTLVGVTTAIALWLLGVPLALLLGFTAGLLTFVPYLGPVIAGVPILMVALLEGLPVALYTLLVYTIIQQIEGNIFDPLILQRIVHLPPAVTVTSQVLGGALLGALGLALATPFAAVMQVLVRRVYREDVLGDPPTPLEAGPRRPPG
jgi:predicted PurR-regulated permease PerM